MIQRVPAPGFREALDQNIVGRIEEQHAQLDAKLFNFIDRLEKFAEKAAAARVDDYGHPCQPAARFETDLNKLWQQRRRNIIHAEIAGILEKMSGSRFAGAREAGNDDQLQWC